MEYQAHPTESKFLTFYFASQNLGEVRTTDLQQKIDPRVGRLAYEILRHTNGTFPFIGCVSGIQFDLPGVPNDKYQTKGKNLSTFIDVLHYLNFKLTNSSLTGLHQAFHSGNCGMQGRAQPKENDEFLNNHSIPFFDKVDVCDLLNCTATLPGQYGLGFWSAYEIISCQVVSELKWKEFHPDWDLSRYRLNGSCPNTVDNQVREDITLFDKSLMIIKVHLLYHKTVTFVILHGTPAYNFGNRFSSNTARNGDQMAFLQWLLTGSTYFKPPNNLKDNAGQLLKPLDPNEAVIASGDFNVDWRDKEFPGAKRLNDLMKRSEFHTFPDGKCTEVTSKGQEMQLDYIISRHIEVVPGSERIGVINRDYLSDHAALVSAFRINIGNKTPEQILKDHILMERWSLMLIESSLIMEKLKTISFRPKFPKMLEDLIRLIVVTPPQIDSQLTDENNSFDEINSVLLVDTPFVRILEVTESPHKMNIWNTCNRNVFLFVLESAPLQWYNPLGKGSSDLFPATFEIFSLKPAPIYHVCNYGPGNFKALRIEIKK